MFSKEIKEKVVLEFLKSGLTYKYFCEKNYPDINHKTLANWVHTYRVKNHLIEEYQSVQKKAIKNSFRLNDKVSEESVSMFCFDVDAIKTTAPVLPPPEAPTQVKQDSIFNITDKIQFQSDILNTYKDLTDVKYSDSNVILLKKIRGLCNEFTI